MARTIKVEAAEVISVLQPQDRHFLEDKLEKIPLIGSCINFEDAYDYLLVV
jgi:hypothetical protein